MSRVRRFWSWLSLEGRAGRREYNLLIWPMVAGFAVILTGGIGDQRAGREPTIESVLGLVGAVMLLSTIGIVAVGRRLHDIGRSVVWIFAVATVLKLAHALQERMPPGGLRDVVFGAPLVGVGVALVVLAVKRGEPDTNIFGPPPRLGRSPPADD